MEGEPSDSAQAEKRWYEFERFLSGAPSNIVETENGCRENAKQAFRAPSDLDETANGWKILARQELRMTNLRPNQQVVQEHAEQNSELPAHNRYNKHSCPNITMKQWKGLLRVTQ